MDLENRVALVTGGARRVGRALSLALARAGAHVIIDHAHSDEEAAGAVAEIEALGRRALAVRADVSSKAEIDRLIAAARTEFGRLDVLVNSASLFESAPFEKIAEADWDRVLAVNLKGPFLLTQAAVPLLRESRGLVVNIADLSAFQAWPSYAHHAVSKAGLVHLTKVAACALAPEVRVNCIAPGTVLPPEEYGEAEARRDAERSLLGRIGTPDDVARALLYLCESDFVTGEVLIVDGGRIVR